jgi:hypothetical protein
MEKKEVFCPYCLKKHEVEVHWREEHAAFDADVVAYRQKLYYCPAAGGFFESAGIELENNEAAFKAYLKHFGKNIPMDFEQHIYSE